MVTNLAKEDIGKYDLHSCSAVAEENASVLGFTS